MRDSILDNADCANPAYAARILDVIRAMDPGVSTAVPVLRGGAAVLMDHLSWFVFGGEISVGVIEDEQFAAVVVTLKRVVRRGQA